MKHLINPTHVNNYTQQKRDMDVNMSAISVNSTDFSDKSCWLNLLSSANLRGRNHIYNTTGVLSTTAHIGRHSYCKYVPVTPYRLRYMKPDGLYEPNGWSLCLNALAKVYLS